MKPRLVTVAHGTRDAAGPVTTSALVRRVRRRLPNVDVAESYVELVEPDLGSVLERSEGPSVVVPLLLSTGYHMSKDIPETARRSRHPVTLAPALGPHPLLAAATAMNLRAAGARRDDAVVLVAAGSSDPAASVDTYLAGRLLQAHWGAPVQVAHLTGQGLGFAEALASLRAEGQRRVVAAPYLLAPGHFADKARRTAEGHGVHTVADVLGAHPLVAELVVRRYLVAMRAARPGASVRRASRVA